MIKGTHTVSGAIIIMLTATVFFSFFCIPTVGDYPLTSEVTITPNTISVSPGEQFSFNVTCTPIQNVKSYELKLRFDPDFIQIDSITEGDFFHGFTTFFNDGTIDNNAGTVKGVYNLIVGSGNTSTNGTLIEVTGTALNNFGFITLELYEIGLTDESDYIPVTFENGLVAIQDFISIFNPNPQNQSSAVDIGWDTLQIDITQMQAELFNYTIFTSPDIGSCSASFQSNGTKSCSISNLAYDTTYEWTVAVQEVGSGLWMNRSFVFSTTTLTAEDVIMFSSPAPSNQSSSVDIDRSSISITIRQTNGGLFDYSIITSPNVGSISKSAQSNGTKTCSISNLAYDTSYTWKVSVKDLSTNSWVNKSYHFTVESEPAGDDDDDSGGGFPPGGGGGGDYVPPPPEDENNAPYKPVKPSGPLYIEPGGTFSYSAQTYDPDEDMIRYRFNWGDGNLSNWTDFVSGNQSVTLSHKWLGNANFSIQVIAQDEEGLNSTWSEGLLVYCSFSEENITNNTDPVAAFETRTNDSENLSVSFNSSMSYDVDGNITSYFWDFGDGTTSTEINPDHSYAEPGWYNVTLIVMDNHGNMYSKTMSVYVASAIDETDTIEEDADEGSFPWLFVYIGIGLVGIVLFLFRKQLFSLFFEIVEIDEQGNIIEESVEYDTNVTFLDQIRKIEQKLNPFSSQPGNQQDTPLGMHAESNEITGESNSEDAKKEHPKHRDIHFIRNRIDDLFGHDDQE